MGTMRVQHKGKGGAFRCRPDVVRSAIMLLFVVAMFTADLHRPSQPIGAAVTVASSEDDAEAVTLAAVGADDAPIGDDAGGADDGDPSETAAAGESSGSDGGPNGEENEGPKMILSKFIDASMAPRSPSAARRRRPTTPCGESTNPFPTSPLPPSRNPSLSESLR